ncbi:hypothetical protein CONCODRAFT_73900 [Conidiobolus coronatus NRRL 28638]|uniref:Uncharacterized protein n=1 Tax=Conidiobolus coronatus (strain ATCC 28846 / CBS 209.66 / NRRL 28638) TaxID=796925 RepID=A0A137NTR2_CONC2|nr:hypothetical protein CONCODRAFT_73900 [Conidiobolus coronatus NRRL 28638]|eukprot:KXN66116.1 hypothetical protein CONCODRAFT_73900 [Conidiobolus coronatus NRRL 28638]
MKLSCKLITVAALVAGIHGQQNIDLRQMQQNAMSELNKILPSGQAQSVINSLQNQLMGPTGSATTIPTQSSGKDSPAPTSTAGGDSGDGSATSTVGSSGDSSATSTTVGSGSSTSTSSSVIAFTSIQGSNGEIISPIKYSYVIAGTLFSMVGSLLI